MTIFNIGGLNNSPNFSIGFTNEAGYMTPGYVASLYANDYFLGEADPKKYNLVWWTYNAKSYIIEDYYFPNLKTILAQSQIDIVPSGIRFFSAPQLKHFELHSNYLLGDRIERFYLPNLTYAYGCLMHNCSVFSSSIISFPKLKITHGINQGFTFQLLPSIITSISLPELQMVYGSFIQGLRSVTSLNFPKLEVISSYASFIYDGGVLSSISLPKLSYISGGQFLYSVNSLKYLHLPNIVSISCNTFVSNASNLSYISFGKNLNSISGMVWFFSNCNSLKTLDFRAVTQIPSLNSNIFSYLYYLSSVYVPKSLYSSFKTANYWSIVSTKMISV